MECEPRGLKPPMFAGLDGTALVVPLQNRFFQNRYFRNRFVRPLLSTGIAEWIRR